MDNLSTKLLSILAGLSVKQPENDLIDNFITALNSNIKGADFEWDDSIEHNDCIEVESLGNRFGIIKYDTEVFSEDSVEFPIVLNAIQMFASLLSRDSNIQKKTSRKSNNFNSYYNKPQINAKLGQWRYFTEKKELYTSQNLHKILGLENQEINMGNFQKVTHPDDSELVISKYHNAIANAEPFDIDHRIVMEDSSIKWVKVICEINSNKGRVQDISGIVLDITSDKKNDKLKSAQFRLIDNSYNSTINEFLVELLDEAEVLTNSKIGFYHFIDEDQENINLQAWSTNTTKHLCDIEIEDHHYPVSKAGVWVDALKKRQPVIHNDYDSLKHKKGLPKGHAPISRELVVPVMKNNKVAALLGVGNKLSNYNETDLNIISELAYTALEIVDRKIAETKLAESEKSFRSLIDLAGDAMYLVNFKGKVIRVNKLSCKMLGYTEQELLSMHISDFDNEFVDLKSQKEIWETMSPEEAITIETSHKHKDGNLIPVEIKASLIEQEGQTYVLGFVRDISDRKKWEHELKESEEKYNSIIQNSPDLTFIQNTKGEVVYLSSQVKSVLGHDPENLLSFNFRDYIHPDDAEIAAINLLKALKGQSIINLEYRFLSFNGKVQWLNHNATSIFVDGKVAYIQSTVRNITDKKELEVTLKDSEEQYRTMIEKSNDMIWTLDKNGNFTFFNAQVEKKTGYLLKDWVGKSFVPICFEEELEFLGDVFKRTIAGESVTYQLRIKTKDNSTLFVDVNTATIYTGGIPSVVSFGRDITIQKAAEIELAKSEATQNEMISNISDVIAIISTEGITKYKSQNIKELFGWDPEDLIGESAFISVHKDDKARVKNIFRELLSTESNKVVFDFKYICKDGSIREVQCTANNLNSNPYVSGILINYHDISRRKKTEVDLKVALEKAKESDLLKSAFLANMSHEIRTPMNGILGFASLLKDKKLSGIQQDRYIGIIERSGNRMLNIINDLIDISKVEAGQMEVSITETNIVDQLEYIYNFFKTEAEIKGLVFRYINMINSDDSLIYSDREKIYAILTNLVKNAIKYTDKGTIELSCKMIGGQLEFCVSDTGIGIASSRQKAIFDRFVQADIADKRALQGAGLGLSITKAYVEMLGGDIWVTSIEGKGSEFYFTIPYSHIDISDSKPLTPDYNTAKDNIRNLKILIAEDDLTSEMFLTIAIEDYAGEILSARTGNQAVDICKSNPDIDLIMMDIKMPELDGYKATQIIRETNKDVIIIAQTAYGLIGDKEKAIEAGCNDYISKPIDQEILAEMIGKYFK